jgi:thiol-disulfide isomerase/thioredoxin
MLKSTLQIIGIFLIFFLWGLITSYFKSGPRQSLNLPDLPFVHQPYEQKSLNQPGKKVIYIWATWCKVCKANKPIVEWDHKIAKLLGVEFYSIEEGEDLNELKKILQESKYEFSVLAGNPEVLKLLEVSGYPTIIFINPNSQKVFQDMGILTPIGFFFRLLFL